MPSVVQGVGYEPFGRLARRSRPEELPHDRLALDGAVHAVRAKEKPVASRKLDETGVDGHHGGDADRVDERIHTAAPFERHPRRGRAHGARREQRFEERVVVGQLDDRRRPGQVHAAIAGVRHERPIAAEQREVERGPHAARFFARLGLGADRRIGSLHRFAQEAEHGMARFERRRLRKAIEDAARGFLPHERGHRFDGEPRGHLAGGVSTHAVRHAEEGEIGKDGERVFVVLADLAYVAGARELDAEVEPGNRYRHDRPLHPNARGTANVAGTAQRMGRTNEASHAKMRWKRGRAFHEASETSVAFFRSSSNEARTARAKAASWTAMLHSRL